MALHVPFLRCALAAACAGGLFTGCASRQPAPTVKAAPPSGPQAGFDADYAAWSGLGYRLDWSGFPFPGLATHRTKDMVAYQDVLAILDSSSNFALLETSTGERRWATELANPLTKFVAVSRDPLDQGRLVVSSQSEAYVLAVATGTLLDREQFSRVVSTRPVIAGNIMIFGSIAGEVVGHLLGRNLRSWAFQGRGSFTSDPVRLADGTVGIASQSGDVLFLTPRGQLVGRGSILGGLASHPVTDGNLLFIAGLDQSVWCFAPSGANIWRHRTSSQLRAQPTHLNGVLYCSIPREGLTSFEAMTGKVLWSNPKVAGTVIGTRDGRALVWDAAAPSLTTIDPVDGEIIETIQLPGVTTIVTDATDNPNLYAMTASGVVGKFIPNN